MTVRSRAGEERSAMESEESRILVSMIISTIFFRPGCWPFSSFRLFVCLGALSYCIIFFFALCFGHASALRV
jgi:hypothetical protein